jgi:hypothetical protein
MMMLMLIVAGEGSRLGRGKWVDCNKKKHGRIRRGICRVGSKERRRIQ